MDVPYLLTASLVVQVVVMLAPSGACAAYQSSAALHFY